MGSFYGLPMASSQLIASSERGGQPFVKAKKAKVKETNLLSSMRHNLTFYFFLEECQ
jgi:hypothetical protein